MHIEIRLADNKKEIKKFIDFPHQLYKGDPTYVPEIFLAQKELLDPKKNPLFKNAEANYYLAYMGNKLVGRIAAILHKNYNSYHHDNAGFFGFFDFIDDKNVSSALLDVVIDWCQQRKLKKIIGPANFSTNDTAGLLVDGFHSSPVVMTTYNYSYYPSHYQAYGLKPVMDLLAYKIPTNSVSTRSLKISKNLEQKLNTRGIQFRSINMKDFSNEVERVRSTYNKAWEKNWGFVPMTKEEFAHLGEGLKMVINPKYVCMAEKAGKVIGFVLAVPDINQIMRSVSKGRLFPLGLPKLLLGKNKVSVLRVITLGVVEEYRTLGIEAIFYSKIIKAAQANGIEYGEASWILEDNTMMINGIKKLHGQVYKTWRMYEKRIDSTG